MFSPRVLLEVFLTSLLISVGWHVFSTIQLVTFLEVTLWAVTLAHLIRYALVRFRRPRKPPARPTRSQRSSVLRLLAVGNAGTFLTLLLPSISAGLIHAQMYRQEFLLLGALYGGLLLLNFVLVWLLRHERKFIFAHASFFLGTLLLATSLLRSLNPPPLAESILLHPPLSENFVTLNGGNNLLQNAFFASSPPYFLSVFALAEERFLPAGISPREQNALSLGQPIHAPAAGEVVEVVRDLPDMSEDTSDVANPLGNHLIIQIAPHRFLFLSNLQQNSVTLTKGASVEVGEIIGRIGISGHSGQPSVFLLVTDQPTLFDPSVTSFPFYFTHVTRVGRESDPGPWFPSRNARFIPHPDPRAEPNTAPR